MALTLDTFKKIKPDAEITPKVLRAIRWYALLSKAFDDNFNKKSIAIKKGDIDTRDKLLKKEARILKMKIKYEHRLGFMRTMDYKNDNLYEQEIIRARNVDIPADQEHILALKYSINRTKTISNTCLG